LSIEDFKIRPEDDLVIQESGGPVSLMKDIPIEIEEIEQLMNS
jgi:Xaa-Pro aminopeptidase